MQPNFIVIGAPKAATTSVCAALAEHPEVYMFPHKGTQFFNRRYDFGWDWYLSLFKESGGAKAIGEGSANYAAGMRDAPVAERMARHLPDAKLIYLVRHPLDRIESHFAQAIDNGMTFPSFSEAVKTFPPLIEASRYWSRLNDFREHYPDEQILVLFYEDFRDDAGRVLRRCLEFLDVSTDYEPSSNSTRRNTRDSKRADRAILRWIRRHPAYVKLQWAFPRWVTVRLKPLLRKRVDIKIEWTKDAREYATSLVREEVGPLLAFCNKPSDYWTLD